MNLDLSKLQEIILSGTSLPHLDYDVCVLPKDYRLESTEKYQQVPHRLRGCFRTEHVDEWIDYCLQHASENSRVFLDPDNFSAVCRLNHGTIDDPHWGDLTAILTLRPSAEYAALKDLIGCNRADQSLMIDYVLDWAPFLRFTVEAPTGISGTPDGEEPPTMAVAMALQRLRKLETKATAVSSHEEQDLKRERSLLESAAFTSDPPGGFVLTCRPYEGLSVRQLPVRLTYHPTSPPKIGVRLVGEATLTRLMAEEFRQLVESGLMDREACSADDSTLHERLHIGRFTRD